MKLKIVRLKNNFKQLQCKTAECEKLKVQLKNSENARNYAEKVCIDIELNKKIYKQALDTVSEYIKDNCNSCQGIKYGGCEKCELKRIKDIISKAKGEE